MQSTVGAWSARTTYQANQTVVVPSDPANGLQQLFVATTTGESGDSPPPWSAPVISDNNGNILWTYASSVPANIVANAPRWKANTLYRTGDVVRCEQTTQKSNLCVANVGGYSGATEPWWSIQSTGPSASAAPATYQRDNQVLWTSAAPSATAAVPSSDQVVNLSVQELPQVHAPSLWGLSTAVLWTTSRIPNSYTFTQPVPMGGCPTTSTAKGVTTTTYCPSVATSYQKAGDIALMISPYVFHHLYSKFNRDAPDGIDTESKWSFTNPGDYIPEPIAGFGLNSIGNSYYAGLSLEFLVRNLQVIGGYAWIKAPLLTNPVSSSGPPSNTFAPSTYSGFKHSSFVGVAFNIAGLISGH